MHQFRISMRILTLLLMTLFIGCAKVPHQPGFDLVKEDVSDRIGYGLHWHTGPATDMQVAENIEQLLGKPLTADSAVRITLINNRRIQEFYMDLGISKADLVHAGLLSNPVFDASVLFPLKSGGTEINLGITQRFLDIFLIPLKKRIAQSQFEEVKAMVSSQIMDLAYDARIAFFEAQADVQRIELLRQKLLTAELSYDLAVRLREAGNITELVLHEQRDHYETSRLKLRQAETSLNLSREHLNRMMGLWGEQVLWKIEDQLPEIQSEDLEDGFEPSELESIAIEASLDLEAARQRIITAGRLVGINDATALIPSFELGVKAEKNDDWALGPSVSFPLPLFNRGLARHHGPFNFRKQQESYTALAVEIRSITRESVYKLESYKDMVIHYQNVILPLRERIVNETQLQYNAMEAGPMDLLRSKEHQIEAHLQYLTATKNYWIARARIEQLSSGSISGVKQDVSSGSMHR